MAGPGLIPAGAVAGTNVVVDVAPLSATISAKIESKIYIYVKGVSRLLSWGVQILTVGSFTFDSFHGFSHYHPGTKGAYIDTNIGYSHWIVEQLILI